MYNVGLTLGKFAPFHRGHQYLVETALTEVRHLIVIVYSARATTDIHLPTRASWIRRLYPAVEVIEAHDSPEDSGDDPEVGRVHEEYLEKFLADRAIDVFYSSEPYGARASRVLRCANRVVDPHRVIVPVSATMIRADPRKYRAFLDPVVLADLDRAAVPIKN